MSTLLIIIFVIVLYILYHWYTMRPSNFPPGPPVLPIIGAALNLWSEHMYLDIHNLRKKYGPLIGYVVPGKLTVAVTDPDMILEVFKNEEMQGRFFSFTQTEVLKSRGIFLDDDSPSWLKLKRFTLKQLRDKGFNKENMIENEYARWLEHIKDKPSIHMGTDMFKVSTMHILWECMTSDVKKYDDEEFNDIVYTMDNLMRIGRTVGFPSDILPWFTKLAPKLTQFDKVSEGIKKISNYSRKEVEKHRRTLDRTQEGKDLLDSFLIEIGKNQFTEEELIAVMYDLILGGSESTASSLGFVLRFMVLYPDVQKKVQDSIDSILGDTKVTLLDRSRLDYVQATILEGLRLYPVAAFAPHRATKDTVLRGYNIPKRTIILLNIWSLNHDEKVFENPEEFRPERHINKDGKFFWGEKTPIFGLGRRLCLGESLARNFLFIFFVSLLQDFTISLPPGDPYPDLLPHSGFTISPKPFRIHLARRKPLKT